MSGQGRGGQKPSQRLGSLAADKDTEKAGRLGTLVRAMLPHTSARLPGHQTCETVANPHGTAQVRCA